LLALLMVYIYMDGSQWLEVKQNKALTLRDQS
jgi:hypothetical protein